MEVFPVTLSHLNIDNSEISDTQTWTYSEFESLFAKSLSIHGASTSVKTHINTFIRCFWLLYSYKYIYFHFRQVVTSVKHLYCFPGSEWKHIQGKQYMYVICISATSKGQLVKAENVPVEQILPFREQILSCKR